MPQYKFVIFTSKNFTTPQECGDKLFDNHGHKLGRDGIGFWAGPGTVPGTFSYKLEQWKTVAGPKRPTEK